MARLRLSSNGVQVETRRRTILFDYPSPPRDVVQFFREYFGPTKVAFSRLDDAGQTAFRDDLEKLWSEHNLASDGKTLIQNEYLEVIGTRLCKALLAALRQRGKIAAVVTQRGLERGRGVRPGFIGGIHASVQAGEEERLAGCRKPRPAQRGAKATIFSSKSGSP